MMRTLPSSLHFLPLKLREEMAEKAVWKTIPKGVEVMHEGQFIQAVPLVVSGLVKVITRYEDREFLLYYIEPNESCIMSFFGVIQEESSKIIAQTEAETELLLLLPEDIRRWIKQYPELNVFFHQLNNRRYSDLLSTIHQVLFENLDTRILNFLREKARHTNDPFIRIRHREIADALGTTREVVSRVTKKLEHEKLMEQYSDGIEVRL
ncbi:MAG: Crp/Fnr family transcriptional regulator [Spirosomaceae bacterium]|jgi:CRP/FNR family transcriptional regulator, anaerobic regulatory protein|nr:Crp/Fnr family transcriptional regulator [Spirosomataceae bacterium]